VAANPASQESQATLDGGQVQPASWPAAKNAGLLDPATEARITRIMAGTSLEEEVGQMMQGDIASIVPDGPYRAHVHPAWVLSATGPMRVSFSQIRLVPQAPGGIRPAAPK
jgi:hypothetical protein